MVGGSGVGSEVGKYGRPHALRVKAKWTCSGPFDCHVLASRKTGCLGEEQMPIVKELRTAGDHWNEMVEPHFCDHQANQADLRGALHCAVSLNHMADWVYENHDAAVRSAFSFQDHKGNPQPVTDAATFANALEQQTPDFGRIRGIANAAKHYKLKSVRPVATHRATPPTRGSLAQHGTMQRGMTQSGTIPLASCWRLWVAIWTFLKSPTTCTGCGST